MLVKYLPSGDPIKEAAREVGVVINCLRWVKKENGWRFTLHHGTDGRYWRLGFQFKKSGERAYCPGGAVCWHGHRDFMGALLKRVPKAQITTRFIRYNSLESFVMAHQRTKHYQAGSKMFPVEYGRLCHCTAAVCLPT